jgi:hypothetical protein
VESALFSRTEYLDKEDMLTCTRILLKNVYAENQSPAIYAVFLAVCEVFLILLSKHQNTSM